MQLAKAHTSAVVLLPPAELWPAINELRRGHDRRFRRWMPHVTLLFPFVDRRRIDQVQVRLNEAVRGLTPFDLQLGRFGRFVHGHRSVTIYLAPEPADQCREVHRALAAVLPEYDDSARFGGSFTPHLTVAQATDVPQADALTALLSAAWHPVSWRVDAVHVVWRNEPPDDVMRIGYRVPFGNTAGAS